MKKNQFTHLKDNGEISMVSVSDKNYTKRIARARGRICIDKADQQGIGTINGPAESYRHGVYK